MDEDRRRKRRSASKKPKRPRLISNNEVLELVRLRQQLHRDFPPEDRDAAIDMMYTSLQHNLMNPDGMGFMPRVAVDHVNPLECDPVSPLKHSVIAQFIQEVRDLVAEQSYSEISILPSEILQLVNLRPKLDGLVKMMMPERGVPGINEEVLHESIANLIKARLCVPEALFTGQDEEGEGEEAPVGSVQVKLSQVGEVQEKQEEALDDEEEAVEDEIDDFVQDAQQSDGNESE